MNKIGFQNFRKFKDFPSLEYGGITFLVGRNNAGKSTFVKAILLLDNYFKTQVFPRFTFSNNILEEVNVVTFGRAKNLSTDSKTIEFSSQIENYGINIILTGEDDKSFANVVMLGIYSIQEGIAFIFDFLSNEIDIRKITSASDIVVDKTSLENLDAQIQDIENQINSLNSKKTSIEYIELVTQLDTLNQKKDDLNEATITTKTKETFNLNTDFSSNLSLLEIVEGACKFFTYKYDTEFKAIQQGENATNEFEDLRAFKEFEPIIVEAIFSHFYTLTQDFTIAYLGSSSIKQPALLSVRDKNNALAQAIHEIVQLGIIKGEEEYSFITKWMKEFEVGSDFEILFHAGEAYEVLINSDNQIINLSDKGMGSIQAMLLIFRVASVIRKIKNADKDSTATIGKRNFDSSKYRLADKTTVIIEEPELNLHPALQSKITDFLFYTNQKYKIDFLIETHSEYMIRRSQVIVADQDLAISELSSNPFKAYYFHDESLPYALNYNADGTFDKNFGKGFFDEASGSTLELIKLKRQKSS